MVKEEAVQQVEKYGYLGLVIDNKLACPPPPPKKKTQQQQQTN